MVDIIGSILSKDSQDRNLSKKETIKLRHKHIG